MLCNQSAKIKKDLQIKFKISLVFHIIDNGTMPCRPLNDKKAEIKGDDVLVSGICDLYYNCPIEKQYKPCI